MIDISQWPAGSVLQGIARHRVLALFAIASGLVDLGLSLALVRPLGVVGVALGTLIPTTIECLLVILPYTLHTLGISLREVLVKAYLPALLPVAPMVIVLLAVRALAPPANLLTVGLTAALGVFVYGLVYFLVTPGSLERQLAVGLARKGLARIWPRA